MFEKNKLKKLLIAALLFAGACSTAPGDRGAGGLPTGLPIDSFLDTSPAAQAEYKEQWLEAVTNKVFTGDPNIWGGGSLGTLSFAFDTEGNLHNTGMPWTDANTWHPLHRVIAFKSGTQAVVRFYRFASTTLYGEILALEIQGDKIYRTQNIHPASTGNPGAMGYTTIAKWDGAGYSSAKITEFARETMGIYPPLEVPAADY